MNIKRKLKSYKFWIGVAGAVGLAAQTAARELGYEIEIVAVNEAISGILGILCVLGLLSSSKKRENLETQELPFANADFSESATGTEIECEESD